MSQQNPSLELHRMVYRLNRLMNEYFQRYMDQEGLHDLQPSIGVVLLPLIEEEGQTLSSLARKLNMKAPTVTVIANRLEERGWIIRERGTDDRRQVRLYLSAEGRRTAEIMSRIRRKMLQSMTGGMDRDGIISTNEALMHLFNNLEGKMP